MACYARPAWTLLFALLTTGVLAAPAAAPTADTAAPASPIEGTWLDSSNSQITVVPCEGGYCGNISKIVVPPALYAAHKKEIDAMGTAGFTDVKNKDPSLRNRPILGLTILTLHPTDKPDAFEGTIYDPDSGDTFSGSLTLISADKMRLEGCLNVPGANLLKNLLCRDRDWTRIADADTQADASAPATKADAAKPDAVEPAPRPHHKTADSVPVSAGSFQ